MLFKSRVFTSFFSVQAHGKQASGAQGWTEEFCWLNMEGWTLFQSLLGVHPGGLGVSGLFTQMTRSLWGSSMPPS